MRTASARSGVGSAMSRTRASTTSRSLAHGQPNLAGDLGRGSRLERGARPAGLLDALAAQTAEHELVVVDAGSTDETAAIAAAAAGARVVSGAAAESLARAQLGRGCCAAAT